MTRPVLVAVVVAMLAACGGSSTPTGPVAGAQAASPVATAAGSDDSIVATVNDRPVWASCVSAQAAAMKLTKQQALDQCVAFELLAQESEKRGHTTAPEVLQATRAALVNRFIETGFEARYAKPSDFGARMEQWLADNAWRMNRPELRASTYVRVEMDPTVDAALDAKGKALADRIYVATRSETGLSAPDISAKAAQIAADSGLIVTNADPPMQPRDTLDKAYADALFSIPEVGRVAPPVRTKWGWDVILWTDGLPALKQTPEQLAETAFPELRRGMFTVWVNGIVKQSGTKIDVHSERLQ